MIGISMVIPCEISRLPMLIKTLERYAEFTVPNEFELVIPSRTITDIGYFTPYPVRVVSYKWQGPLCLGQEVFNPSKALNLGVKNAKYANILITSPEVLPITNVLAQFAVLDRGNYICQVWEMKWDGTRGISLINKQFRSQCPGYYFLAIYRKEDILVINGWNNAYMGGCGYDDDSFSARFVRAKFPFEIREEIQAQHQWHPSFFWDFYEYRERNLGLLQEESRVNAIRCPDGLNETIPD